MSSVSAAESDVDEFREVGTLAAGSAVSSREESTEDDLVAEWRGRWDEF